MARVSELADSAFSSSFSRALGAASDGILPLVCTVAGRVNDLDLRISRHEVAVENDFRNASEDVQKLADTVTGLSASLLCLQDSHRNSLDHAQGSLISGLVADFDGKLALEASRAN